MEFNEIMQGFAQQINLENFTPDGDGVYRIAVDGMSIAFMEHVETQMLVTWAEVCDQPPEGRDLLYKVIMEAMFLGSATGGSTFSIESESQKVFLHRLDALQLMDLEKFNAMLEKFVNILEQWRQIIADFRPVAAELEKGRQDAAAESTSFSMGGSGFMQV